MHRPFITAILAVGGGVVTAVTADALETGELTIDFKPPVQTLEVRVR